MPPAPQILLLDPLPLPREVTSMQDRHKVIEIAKAEGWKPWGTLKLYGKSSYQCFRRGNEYAWIGLAYVESAAWAHALYFPVTSKAEISRFLKAKRVA